MVQEDRRPQSLERGSSLMTWSTRSSFRTKSVEDYSNIRRCVDERVTQL